MKAIGMLLLSIGLAGSLCGCQTTTPGAERKHDVSYLLNRTSTDPVTRKVTALPGIAQQKATIQASMKNA